MGNCHPGPYKVTWYWGNQALKFPLNKEGCGKSTLLCSQHMTIESIKSSLMGFIPVSAYAYINHQGN